MIPPDSTAKSEETENTKIVSQEKPKHRTQNLEVWEMPSLSMLHKIKFVLRRTLAARLGDDMTRRW